jgi:probable rRNA maturation factor
MKPEAHQIPAVSVRNLQRRVVLDRVALEQFARRALNACLRERGRGLTSFEEIGVLLVSDRKISELHRRFMGISGPTDVITFQHGEIFISVETAQRQAEVFGTSLEYELRLYLVHGLLHLHGLDDLGMADRRRMRSAQERVVALALGGSKAADTGIGD